MKAFVRVGLVVVSLLASSGLALAQVTSAVLQGVVTDSQGGVLPGRHRQRHQYRNRPRARGGVGRRRLLPRHGASAGPVRRAGDAGRVHAVLTHRPRSDRRPDRGDRGHARPGGRSPKRSPWKPSAPLVDTSSNALGTTVTKAQLDDLPLAGRDFASLARLAPGVTGVGGGGITLGRAADPQQQRRRRRHQQRRTRHRRHARQLLARIGARVRHLHESVRGRARARRRGAGQRRDPIGHQQARRPRCSPSIATTRSTPRTRSRRRRDPARRRSASSAAADSSAGRSSRTRGTTSGPTSCSATRPPTS